MKRIEMNSKPGFRELSNEEMNKTRGGKCFFPILYAQELFKKLLDKIRD